MFLRKKDEHFFGRILSYFEGKNDLGEMILSCKIVISHTFLRMEQMAEEGKNSTTGVLKFLFSRPTH